MYLYFHLAGGKLKHKPCLRCFYQDADNKQCENEKFCSLTFEHWVVCYFHASIYVLEIANLPAQSPSNDRKTFHSARFEHSWVECFSFKRQKIKSKLWKKSICSEIHMCTLMLNLKSIPRRHSNHLRRCFLSDVEVPFKNPSKMLSCSVIDEKFSKNHTSWINFRDQKQRCRDEKFFFGCSLIFEVGVEIFFLPT